MAFTLWLTGLPCSGKTTIAKELLKIIDAQHLDGDIIRRSLTKDLDFSIKDRTENIRRVSIVCNMLNNAGINVVATFISPTEKIRRMARRNVSPNPFILVAVECPLKQCMKRDIKGLYAKAQRGEISNFTGISASYERPVKPDILVNTYEEAVEESSSKIIRFLEKRGFIRERYTLFIGRWSPPHKGHKYLFDSVLNNGGKICIAIRDTPLTEKDPLTIEQRKQLLRALYPDNPNVKIIVIPDINEVCVGRKVGYRIMAVPEKIREISATRVRRGEFNDVPEEIRPLLKKLLNKRKA